MYWNKRFLLIIALLFVVFGNVLAQSPYRIRLADSTYAAQLRGVTGTRTAGITITGTYKSNFRAHQFNVTTTGRYDLYIDATGTGSSYSKDAVWSGTVGKTVVGKTDLERTVSLGVYADPDSNAQIDTQGYENESVTLIKLAPEVLAAMATGGSFTSDSLRDMIGDSIAALSADGVTIINDGTFKIKPSYVDSISRGFRGVYGFPDTNGIDLFGLRTLVKKYLFDQNPTNSFSGRLKSNFGIAKGANYTNSPSGKPYRIAIIGNSLVGYLYAPFRLIGERMYNLNGLGLEHINTGYGSSVTFTSSSGWASYEGDEESQRNWGITGSAFRGGVGDTLSYQPSSSYPYMDLRLYYLKKSGGGTFDVIWNGDTTAINSSSSSDELGILRLKSTSYTNHKMVLRNIQSDSATVYAIETFTDGQGGFLPCFLNRGGSRAWQWKDNMGFYRALQDTLDAETYVVWLGANDAGTEERTAAQFSADMQTIIDTLQAIDTTQIIISTNYPRRASSVSTSIDTDFYSLITAYRDSLLSIAQSQPLQLEVWDVYGLWPEFTYAYRNGFYSDQIHPTERSSHYLAISLLNQIFKGYTEGYITKKGTNYYQGRQAFYRGSESLPSITFGGISTSGGNSIDNTGFYSTGSGNFSFAAQGTRLMSYYSNPLELAAQTFYPTTSNPRAIYVMRLDNATAKAFHITSDNGGSFYLDANGYSYFRRAGTNRMRIGETALELYDGLKFIAGGVQIDSLQFKEAGSVDSLQIYVRGQGWKATPLNNSGGN